MKLGIAVLANVAVVALIVSAYVSFGGISLSRPLDGASITETTPTLEWRGGHGPYTVEIGKDPSFSGKLVSAEVTGNSFRAEHPLDLGEYYWRVSSGGKEAQGRFTIESEVALERAKEHVRNSGNVETLVRGITGFFVLGVGDSVEVNKNESITAEQK